MANRIAFITGASRGIGRACAFAMASDGAKVVLAARQVDKLEEVAAQIRALGGEACVVPIDLASPESIKEAFANANEYQPYLATNQAKYSHDRPAVAATSRGLARLWPRVWDMPPANPAEP